MKSVSFKKNIDRAMESLAAKNKQALTKKTYEVNFDLSNTQYEAVENIGSGAYGVVCSAMNTTTKEKVAIKKIPNIFEQEVIAKRTYREIKILKHFKHDNIIAIREILKPVGSADNLRDVFIVFDLMESDLHRIIHSKQDLSLDHVKYFVYQILCGLQYIHSANVVHRDLKPSNLLVNANCDLKIGDFGMARGMGFVAETDCKLTHYVATRWYRAPELMLSRISYTASVDMWSVGCIFAELLGRKIIFMGKNPIQQLYVIMETLGKPPKHLQDSYYDLHNKVIKGHAITKQRSLRDRIPQAPILAMDLLERLLVYDPVERLDVYKTLKHHFLAKYHDPDCVYEKPCIPVFDFDFEKNHMTRNELKESIVEEIMFFHRPKRRSKIPFNFKPVPKSELAKTQQIKAAALKAKQEREIKPSSATVTTNKQTTQADEQTTTELDSAFTTRDSAFTTRDSGFSSFNAPDSKELSTTDAQQPTGFDVFLSQNAKQLPSASRNLFKVPHAFPVSQQQQLLHVSTLPDATIDVEMISAGRSGAQRSCQGQGQSLGSSAADIEMLSAKSEVKLNVADDFKIDLSHTSGSDVRSVAKQSTSTNEEIDVKITECKDDKVSNTKEKLKAAILEAALRKQRGDVISRPKPVTAIQRQREKEEKRRKKIERAKGKKKKNVKDKSPLLTVEDRELLQRWTNMQQRKTPEKQQPPPQPSVKDISMTAEPTSNQSRAILSPKNTNYVVTDMVTMPTQSSNVSTDTRLGYPVGFENTHPQVLFMPNYVTTTPSVGVVQTSSSHVEASARGSNLQSLYTGSYGSQISHPDNSNKTNSLPLQQMNASSRDVTQQTRNSSTKGYVQLLYDAKPPPDYEQTIQAVARQSNTMVDNKTDMMTSQRQAHCPPTASHFVPFQSYDPNSAQRFNAVLTPDLGMFVSPATPLHADTTVTTTPNTPSSHNNAVTSSQSQVTMVGVDNEPKRGAEQPAKDNAQMLSIITQMKRSHVNDPLLLTLTPKTTGEPYGVGPEILPDVFLSDDRPSAQLSAMSNTSATESLIGDWLDVSGMEGIGSQDYETLNKVLKDLEPDRKQ